MSKLIESRVEFQQLAQVRLDEAKVLLDVGKWGGAYYLAGYAVELALKACIIRTLMATDAFPDRGVLEELLHALHRKARLAGQVGQRSQDCDEFGLDPRG